LVIFPMSRTPQQQQSRI